MTERRYPDPAALRRAVTDRLRTLARDQHAQLADLQRQFAYDRFLARLFLSEPDRWVLKGATALLARLGGAARHTLDVDLYRPGERLAQAEAALRAAAASDLGDFFRFALAPGRRVAEGRDTAKNRSITATCSRTCCSRSTSFALIPRDEPGQELPAFDLLEHVGNRRNVCR